MTGGGGTENAGSDHSAYDNDGPNLGVENVKPDKDKPNGRSRNAWAELVGCCVQFQQTS